MITTWRGGWLAMAFMIAVVAMTPPVHAADAVVIEARVEAALVELQETTPGASMLLESAKGVLVMPNITKAGFIVGGEYGEGALRVNGVTEGYYSLAGGSFGFQAGVQTVSQVLLFMTDEALNKFRNTRGWEVGGDAEVTLIKVGTNISADTTKTNRPVIAFVFGQDGLLAGASLQGSKYSKIQR